MADAKTTADKAFQKLNENKIEKSKRNCEALNKDLVRATKFEFDEDVVCVTGASLLKVNERFTIRKEFNLDKGEYEFRLYKEVFYIVDPAKYYYDDIVEDKKVYRRIARQHEVYTEEQAKNVAKLMHIDIVEA